MLKTKYEYNFYSFYDHTGMEQHFEKMAAQGWLIEKLGYFWRYRRIGPQALRFSVVYYSEASEFDPTKPSEGELTFYDFCAQAGWNKAASRAQMNVFYNEDANAVPIETDAALQVETLHQSMKKEQLIAWFLMLALALWIFFDMRKGFIRDFAAALSRLSALSAILDSVLLFLLCALELGGYYLWRRRAKREAKLGRFLPTRSHPVLQMLALLVLVMGCAVVLYSDKEGRGTYLAILTGIVLLDALIWGIKGLLKRRGGSAELNRGITLVSVLILSFIFSFTYLRSVRNGQFDQTPENATRYEVTWSNGETSFYYAYDDPLPLYVKDLTKTDYDRYSCELAEESSPLASQVRGAQRMRTGDEDDAPELNYEVTDVKFAPLFDACLDGELKYYQNYTVTFYRTHRPFRNWEYREVDAAPWGADRAWQAFDTESDGWGVSWVLTRGKRIVRIGGSALTGTLSQAQMDTISEKLLDADIK